MLLLRFMRPPPRQGLLIYAPPYVARERRRDEDDVSTMRAVPLAPLRHPDEWSRGNLLAARVV